MKVIVSVLLALALAFFVSLGCVYKTSGDAIPSAHINDYLEAFYLTPQKDKIVIVGEKYHYVLERYAYAKNSEDILLYLIEHAANEGVIFYLSQENLAHFSTSYLIEPEEFYAIFYVGIDMQNSSQALINWARTRTRYDKKSPVFFVTKDGRYLKTSVNLTGRRYRADAAVNAQLPLLKQPFEIWINDAGGDKPLPPTPFYVDDNGTLYLDNEPLILLDDIENKLQ